MWGIAVKARYLRLNSMQLCHSSRSAALLGLKPWLVTAVTNITCATSRCSTTGSLATIALVEQLRWCKLPTWDQPDEVSLAGPLELQRSAVAGTKSCQNGTLPTPTGHSKCRARKLVPGPNGIHLAWHLRHSISPVSLCSPVPKKSRQHHEAAPQVN